MVPITSTDMTEAWKLFVSYHDQEFSFTDCTSFVVMRRLRIRDALTLDKRFAVMGYTSVV